MDKTDAAIANALNKLAEKLGTTAEYLWKVLCKQAIVNGISNIFIYLLVSIVTIVIFKAHVKFCDKNKTWSYHNAEHILVIPMLLVAAIICLAIIACFFSISDTFNSFLNPEYWALTQILKKL